MGDAKIRVRPITLREANAFVQAHHRHHRPTRGCLFCVSAFAGDTVHGVAIAGRPVARRLQDGLTAEVVRCCTDGTRNCPSMLYRALWRAAKAIGYERLITYTLAEEGGGSLRAAGFHRDGAAGGGAWSRESRARADDHPLQEKVRWSIQTCAAMRELGDW